MSKITRKNRLTLMESFVMSVSIIGPGVGSFLSLAFFGFRLLLRACAFARRTLRLSLRLSSLAASHSGTTAR